MGFRMSSIITKEKHANVNDKESYALGSIVVCFLFVATHKLTNSSLWFDEAIEYWYSKSLIGTIPFNGDAAYNTTNMYERIVSTFQPPLYNFLMYFWLLISDSEWWFAFFGVLMGLISLLGAYLTIKQVSNYVCATLGSILFIFNYYLCFYWQECAEYCLLLAFVSWICYWFLKALHTKELSAVAMFTLCSIGGVCSQYGAALIAIPLGLTLILFFFLEGRPDQALKSVLFFAAAVVVVGLPLYWFFLKIQLANGNSNAIHASPIEGLKSSGILDYMINWIRVVKGVLFPYYERPVGALLAMGFTVVVFGAFFISEERIIKASSLACLLTYTFFYLAVKSGLYSYGSFLGGWNNSRTRYALFLIPLFITVFAIASYGIFKWIESSASLRRSFQNALIGAFCCSVACYAAISWTDNIAPNWVIGDVRGLVQDWYASNQDDTPTIVYYGADALFSYYAISDPLYNESIASRISYQDWVGGLDEADIDASLDKCFDELGGRPDRFFFAVSHNTADLDYMLRRFKDEGYSASIASEKAGAKLYELKL